MEGKGLEEQQRFIFIAKRLLSVQKKKLNVRCPVEMVIKRKKKLKKLKNRHGVKDLGKK